MKNPKDFMTLIEMESASEFENKVIDKLTIDIEYISYMSIDDFFNLLRVAFNAGVNVGAKHTIIHYKDYLIGKL